MTVRAHNARQFSDIRRTNDGELHAFIVVFEEPSDAVMGGNGIHMHIGIATPQIIDAALELVIVVLRLDVHRQNGRLAESGFPQRVLHNLRDSGAGHSG